MSCAYETFLVARPIIAILGPKWVYVIPGFSHSFDQVGPTRVVFLVLTDIVVRVSPRTLRSITDLLLPKNLTLRKTRNPAEKDTSEYRPPWVKPAEGIAILWAILNPTGQLGSRPLTESTKQITPPTKSGHAPPFRGSRKNTQSVNPHPVRIW
ncbi:hypothetical protein TcBrA4_0034560 [Trypanosoma cruzi]|nr:hypothetical protein TcBrA4_0034560 [Trypanosoma cruzi]